VHKSTTLPSSDNKSVSFDLHVLIDMLKEEEEKEKRVVFFKKTVGNKISLQLFMLTKWRIRQM
jgi:hypothetical protein